MLKNAEEFFEIFWQHDEVKWRIKVELFHKLLEQSRHSEYLSFQVLLLVTNKLPIELIVLNLLLLRKAWSFISH